MLGSDFLLCITRKLKVWLKDSVAGPNRLNKHTSKELIHTLFFPQRSERGGMRFSHQYFSGRSTETIIINTREVIVLRRATISAQFKRYYHSKQARFSCTHSRVLFTIWWSLLQRQHQLLFWGNCKLNVDWSIVPTRIDSLNVAMHVLVY